MDRFGLLAGVFVLCVGFFLAAIWFLNQPSFEKCSTLENAGERNACYDMLRSDLSKLRRKAQIFQSSQTADCWVGARVPGAFYRPQSSSASRFTAGAFGFLTFTQCAERWASTCSAMRRAQLHLL